MSDIKASKPARRAITIRASYAIDDEHVIVELCILDRVTITEIPGSPLPASVAGYVPGAYDDTPPSPVRLGLVSPFKLCLMIKVQKLFPISLEHIHTSLPMPYGTLVMVPAKQAVFHKSRIHSPSSHGSVRQYTTPRRMSR